MMKMQILVLSLVFISILTAYAWDDCPFGVTDYSCEFPGACGRYSDTNNNQICDHSEPAPEQSDVSNLENVSYDDLVESYVSISGKELKTYTIKDVSNYYGIKSECFINKLNINANEDLTLDQVKSIYGISVIEMKYAIFDCMVEEGIVDVNSTNSKPAIETETTLSKKIIDFLFTWIDLRSFLVK